MQTEWLAPMNSHLWLLYRPEVEHMILCTVMKYFPHKLKVRNPKPKHGHQLVRDTIYESLDALRARSSRLPTHPKEGAQVELARIDRSISSGASYAMKYLLKTVDGGDKLNEQCGLFPDQRNAALQEKRQAHRTAASVWTRIAVSGASMQRSSLEWPSA